MDADKAKTVVQAVDAIKQQEPITALGGVADDVGDQAAGQPATAKFWIRKDGADTGDGHIGVTDANLTCIDQAGAGDGIVDKNATAAMNW